MQLFQLPKSATTEVGLLIDRRIKQRSARYPIGGVPKRLLDIFVSSSALLAFAPLFFLVALLLKVSDRGAILYRQPRVGFRSSTFGCLKFRTMVMDGDAILARYLRDNPEAAKEWAETRKLKRDPRVTAIGQVLRQTSLETESPASDRRRPRSQSRRSMACGRSSAFLVPTRTRPTRQNPR